jgi:hypothetical protein
VLKSVTTEADIYLVIRETRHTITIEAILHSEEAALSEVDVGNTKRDGIFWTIKARSITRTYTEET